jgi:hypothetical protein
VIFYLNWGWSGWHVIFRLHRADAESTWRSIWTGVQVDDTWHSIWTGVQVDDTWHSICTSVDEQIAKMHDHFDSCSNIFSALPSQHVFIHPCTRTTTLGRLNSIWNLSSAVNWFCALLITCASGPTGQLSAESAFHLVQLLVLALARQPYPSRSILSIFSTLHPGLGAWLPASRHLILPVWPRSSVSLGSPAGMLKIK